MKRLLLLLSLLTLVACSTSPSGYVDWLYRYMPLPDSLQYSRAFWEDNVAKTLEVRNKMPWNIPEREFRHFVLPLRVNNESLDSFRLEYADTLCSRVKGMSLTEAALEINHWCHEQASYQPSDARTSSPMATVRRGVGRCGEESVLTVAALRAAGIPARQVYTPRWAHTDDNHAWVEVFTGRKWHFLGACEPAPTLDNAWFNGPVSRALLLHTKVFGDYRGPEDVISRTPCYTEINVIRNYVPSRKTKVTVLEENPASVGKIKAEGATVGFTIYNYGEFYTVATFQTGANGTASLYTGRGDMLVWARKDDRFGFAVASSDKVTITLNHRIGDRISQDLVIIPPPEKPIPTRATKEQEEANAQRLAEEDAIRARHPHNNPDADAFIEDYGPAGQAILDLLSEKDKGDVTRDVLEDAVEWYATQFISGKLKEDQDLNPYLASQRIELEPLRPVRWNIFFSGIGDKIHNPREAAAWIRGNVKLTDGRNSQNLRTAPAASWKARQTDSTGRNLLFVALCRTLGFPARIDPVTGRTQYQEGKHWTDINWDDHQDQWPKRAPTGYLFLLGAENADYYRDYTITSISDKGTRLLEFEEDAPRRSIYTINSGYYLVTSGTRLPDGSVLAHLEFFTLNPGTSKEIPLILKKQKEGLSAVGHFNVPQAFKDAAGSGLFVAAALGAETDEPTSHALREFPSAGLDAANCPLLVIGDSTPSCPHVSIQDPDGSLQKMLLSATGTGKALPAIVLCDTDGNIYYISQGYNTSLANDLKTLLAPVTR